MVRLAGVSRLCAAKWRPKGAKKSPYRVHPQKGWRGASVTVPETATGGRGEYPQARGITPAKELCKMSP